MKKKIITIIPLVILPLMVTSCQKESPSLDGYEIKEVGTKSDQVIKYLTLPFNIDFCTDEITIGSHSFYDDKTFFFKSPSAHFSYEESLLFANKYSCNADLVTNLSICAGTSFVTYARENEYTGFITFKIKDKDSLSGRYAIALVGDLKEYSATSKTNLSFNSTIYVLDSVCVVSLIKVS